MCVAERATLVYKGPGGHDLGATLLPLSCCLGYFSIMMTKYYDQGNLEWKASNGGLRFQKVRVHDHRCRERGSRQADMALE